MCALTKLRGSLVAAAIGLAFAGTAVAQTVLPSIPVGAEPRSIAVNPVTNKIFVGNFANDNITIINGANNTTTTVGAGDGPRYMAINNDNGKLYVSNVNAANVMIFNADTGAFITQLNTGGGGWTAIDPYRERAYVVRFGSADEVNFITDERYDGTAATRSFGTSGIVVNPVNQRSYMPNNNPADTDVASMDMTTYTPYPTLYCPNGSGGFRAQPSIPPLGDPDPTENVPPCIAVPDTPTWVTVNPFTGKAFSISNGTSNQVSVITPVDHSFTSINVAGATGGRVIANNPITARVYALFGNMVAVINADTNAVITTIPFTGGVGIGVNVLTNTIYVPNTTGNLLVINGADNTNSTIAIPADALAIGVNPVSNMVYVSHLNSTVTPIAGAAGTPTATGISTTVAPLSGNTSGPTGSIQLTAASSMAPAPLNAIRRVYFRIDNGPWTLATGTGTNFSANYAGLAPGAHTLTAFATNGLDSPSINTDLAVVPIVGNLATYNFTVGAATAPAVALDPSTIDFGGQSMGTTSPGVNVTVTNSGSGTLTISGVATSAQFTQTNNCTTGLAAGQSCTVTVRFSPAVAPGLLNSTVDVEGALSITSNAASSPNQATLLGTAEKSLVSHYYRSILGRAADAGGKQFWQNEAARVAQQGANVNEAWYALAAAFFTSGEYAAFNRTNEGFVADLYNTFFNRAPDAGGLAFWKGQIDQGLPREVALAAFMFSGEFANFTTAIFGNTAARAEVDMVGDFYRGLLARLPDQGGFSFWVNRFRSAQCAGNANAVVRQQVEEISSLFATSGEYAARNRSTAQYVGDLYNAFLRRGGDLDGVNFWINQINSGAQSREQVRVQFVASAEFNQRVINVVNQGCL